MRVKHHINISECLTEMENNVEMRLSAPMRIAWNETAVQPKPGTSRSVTGIDLGTRQLAAQCQTTEQSGFPSEIALTILKLLNLFIRYAVRGNMRKTYSSGCTSPQCIRCTTCML